MAEKPILFSGPMVRAILERRKTQTRRVAKFRPRSDGLNLEASSLVPGHYCTGTPEHGWVLQSRGAGGCWNDRTYPLRSPCGHAGDILWVRETWAIVNDEGPIMCPIPASRPNFLYGTAYRADQEEWPEDWRWRPGIHMPRWAARIFLEVIEVRVEHLQEITLEGVRAEGVPETWGDWGPYQPAGMQPHEWDNMRWDEQWHWLWDSLNATRGYGWETNPWVWVVTFTLLDSPIEPEEKPTSRHGPQRAGPQPAPAEPRSRTQHPARSWTHSGEAGPQDWVHGSSSGTPS